MDGARIQREKLATLLTVGAVLAILTGLAIGLLVSPFGYIVVAVGLLDFVWIALLRSGRVGPAAPDAAAAEPPAAEPPAPGPDDPYARED